MTRDHIANKYFKWMCGLVSDGGYFKRKPYHKLFAHLHSREFTYVLGLDGNRAEDGVDLRYFFGDAYGYSEAMVAHCLDDGPCSILEMMVALAVRCEDHIMDDPEAGNRTAQWFWKMVASLGLMPMHDIRFDPGYTDKVLDGFLNREYKRDGKGGLFTVRHRRGDMRSVEIWYQAMWYLDEALNG